MRKTFSFIIMVITMFFVCNSITLFSFKGDITTNVAYASSLSDNVVITLSGETDEQGIAIKANLRQNTGLNGMTIEISYDNSIMTLINVERGTALSSLDYITTNVDTDKGYAITPFKINWSGDRNDESTGLIFTMNFAIKENVTDGEYLVTLKSDKSTVTYVDEGVKTKSALIDGVKIYIKGNSVEKIVEEVSIKDNTPIIIIAVTSGAAFIGIATGVFLFFKLKGRKAWKKLK